MYPNSFDYYEEAKNYVEARIQEAEDYRRWTPDEGNSLGIIIPGLILLIFLSFTITVVVL